MPRKISEFFQPISKISINQEVKSKTSTTKSSKIRECRVVLKDINQQIFKNQLQIFENIKIEPEKEYLTIVEQQKIKVEPDVFHMAKKIKTEDEDELEMVKLKEKIWAMPEKSEKFVEKLVNSGNSENLQQICSKPQLKNANNLPTTSRIIKCKFCPSRFSSYNRHSSHIRKVHSSNLLTCDLCYSKCSTLIGIRSHMTNKHLNKKFQPFICDYCGREWKTKARLYYHVLSHRPRIECQICHVKIKHVSMQEHLRDFHVDERKFKCKMCTKTFKADKDLNRHEKVHLKKFNCQICFRKFRLQYDLNVHVRQNHENPGSFKCEICGRKFNEKVVLKRHLTKHQNVEKHLKCDRCDYATADNQLYKRHYNVHKRRDEKDVKLKKSSKM